MDETLKPMMGSAEVDRPRSPLESTFQDIKNEIGRQKKVVDQLAKRFSPIISPHPTAAVATPDRVPAPGSSELVQGMRQMVVDLGETTNLLTGILDHAEI